MEGTSTGILIAENFSIGDICRVQTPKSNLSIVVVVNVICVNFLKFDFLQLCFHTPIPFFTLGFEIAKSNNCVNMSLYFYAFLEVKKEKEYMVHEKCKTLLEFHKVLHISAGLSVLK